MVAPIIPVAAAVARLVAKHGVPALQKAIKTQKNKSVKNKPGSGRRATNQVKNTRKLSVDPNAPRSSGGYYGEAYGAITNKEMKRIQLKGSLGKKTVKKTERKKTNSANNMLDREVKNAVKRGATKYSGGPLKDGARKPSVSSKLKGKGPRGR